MLRSRTTAAMCVAVCLSLASATPSAARPGRLEYGSSGPAVLALQRTLKSLSYPAGPADGRFGPKTLQAVYAFEKVHRLRRDGVVTPKQLAKIKGAERPRAPARPVGSFLEVDLSRQVLFEVRDGRVARTIPVSTGNLERYRLDGVVKTARTPTGGFSVGRKIARWRRGPLGDLYYPLYSYEGYAIHGSTWVPPYPASHGCVRMPLHVAKRLYRRNPIGTPVYIHR
jgi:peptidoglycan hydrolase-like protein with peptidoglycan-binding domain